jgi:hypothetical protein
MFAKVIFQHNWTSNKALDFPRQYSQNEESLNNHLQCQKISEHFLNAKERKAAGAMKRHRIHVKVG